MICGKRIYNSRQEAVQAITGFHHDKRNSRSKIQPNAAYYCQECDGWHLTSGEQKRPKMVAPKSNNTEVHSIDKNKKNFEKRTGHKSLVIHTRLNFKIK